MGEISPKTATGLGEYTPSAAASELRLELMPELVHIPAGQFVMGADEGDADEGPEHVVSLDGFYIAAKPVTNADYEKFIQHTGYRIPAVHELPWLVSAAGTGREVAFLDLAARFGWQDRNAPAGRANHPATLVRYEDATAYCQWLSRRTGAPFRLPTEAEWEKAARGGLERQPYPWGRVLDEHFANYTFDEVRRHEFDTKPVGCYPPNRYGLFDASGNVWEWVADWYGRDYYERSPLSNPPGPAVGRLRIVRGGGWPVTDARMLRVSHRHEVPVDTYAYSIGFRVACSKLDGGPMM